MMGMLENFVLPRLREIVGTARFYRRTVVKLFGPPESEIAERIQDMLGRDRNPLLGLLPQRGTITVELAAWGTTLQQVERLLASDVKTLQETFGRQVLCQDERSLPQVVGDLLAQRGLTLAVVEAADGTGGQVVARLTEAEENPHWLKQGEIVNQKWTEKAVRAAAVRARQEATSDVGLAVGSLHSPADTSPGRPYRVLFAAIALGEMVTAQRFSRNGERTRARELLAEAVLDMLRLRLLG